MESANLFLQTTTEETPRSLVETYLEPAYLEYLVEKVGPLEPREEAILRIEECLKLLLLLPFSKRSIPVTHEIDDVWHWMILETLAYQRLCEKLPTGGFLHHRSLVYEKHERIIEKNPAESPGPELRKKELQEKVEWLISYRRNFGEFKESTLKFWPYALEIIKDKKIDLCSLNSILK